ERPSPAAARLPGRAGDRRRARAGRRDDRRDGPRRRRRPRQRPGPAPGAGRGRAARDARRADPLGRAPAAAGGGSRPVRALISVYDKEGVVELARGLSDLGWEVVASGGTAAHLQEHGVEVETVEEL